jgi:hypothetical protein
MDKNHLRITDIAQIINAFPHLFQQIKEENQINLQEFQLCEQVNIHDILEVLYPLYLQEKSLWHESFKEQNLIYAHALSKTEYKLIKDVLNKWTFGVGELEKGYPHDVLERNIVQIETIPHLQSKLKRLLVIWRKIKHVM